MTHHYQSSYQNWFSINRQRNIYIYDNIIFRNSKLTAFLMLNTLDMHYAVKNILHFLIADGVSK